MKKRLLKGGKLNSILKAWNLEQDDLSLNLCLIGYWLCELRQVIQPHHAIVFWGVN